MGGRRASATRAPPLTARELHPGDRAAGVRPAAAPSTPSGGRRIVCPIAGCGAENDAAAQACIGCLTPLAASAAVLAPRRRSSTSGLRAARAGDSAGARECFAAVALWQPHDVTTRNAHALACLDAGDVAAAARAWERCSLRTPEIPLALRGLAALSRRLPDGEDPKRDRLDRDR